MKRIFISMSVVCILVVSLVSLPRAEEDKAALPEAPAVESKQSLDQPGNASLSAMAGCCEIPGDANDDGLLNAYDYLFGISYGIQGIGTEVQVYPVGFCFNQMKAGSAGPPAYFTVYIFAQDKILNHLFRDLDITLVCGTWGSLIFDDF